jgi:hypothetical protein
MRRYVLVVLACAAAALPAAPASADCNVVVYALTGRCENVCGVVRDAVPDLHPICFA